MSSIVRVFEHPDGTVSVTVPAPASRGVIEHPFEKAVRVPSSLTVQEHNAAIAGQVDEIVREHPELADVPSRLEVSAEVGAIDDDGSNLLDVTVRVVFGVPEQERVWLERAFARVVETQPDLDGLPYHDVDPTTLPPRTTPCADGCGEEHPVRNLWRVSGNGKTRQVQVDRKLRNSHAEIRHLEHAEQHEMEKDTLDGGRLATIDAMKRSLVRHHLEGTKAPRAELVASLTADALRSRKDS